MEKSNSSASIQLVCECRFMFFDSLLLSGGSYNVGFIGLGEMGFRMAKNLLKNNVRLVGYDLRSEPLSLLEKEFGSQQFKLAREPHEIMDHDVNVVVTMLPEGKHVLQCYLESGEKSLFHKAKKGTLFIDSSTIGPAPARILHKEALLRGFQFVDAPVSGGIRGAEEGTLTFMVGSPDEVTLNNATPILKMMGKSIVDCKGQGNGQVAKIANNLVLGISMGAVSEGMNLGISLGMDPETLAGIFNTSTARCWSSDSYNPVPGVMENIPSSRDYVGGFGVDLMIKDLKLACDAGKEAGTPLNIGKESLATYEKASKSGLGKKDFSVVYQYLKNNKEN